MLLNKKLRQRVKRINERIRKKNLIYSIYDGSAASISTSVANTYVTPFAIALKATNTQIAFLSSMPRLLSSLMQLFTADVVQRFKNRKKLILLGVLLQALCWFPLFILPFIFKSFSLPFLITFFTLYIVLGEFIAPAWNSLMGDIVKEDERGTYFGKRNKAIGVVATLTLIIAGIILFLYEGINVWVGFGIIFFISMVGRLISFCYLYKMHDPRHKVKQKANFNFSDFVSKLRHTHYGRYVVYHSLFRFAVSVSSPFYSAFMLYDMGFNYLSLMIVYTAASLATLLTMIYWGRHIDIFGNKKIMAITGWVIVCVPFLWLVPWTTSIVYLFIIQMLSGFVWAGFNLSTSNYHFDAVTPKNRTRAIAYHNVLMGLLVFVAALIGSFIANNAIAPSFLMSRYQVVFFVSGFFRFLAMWFYMPVLKEMRRVKPSDTTDLFIKLVAVRPISGIIFEVKGGLNKSVGQFDKHVGRHLKRHLKTGVVNIDKQVDRHIRSHIRKGIKDLNSRSKRKK